MRHENIVDFCAVWTACACFPYHVLLLLLCNLFPFFLFFLSYLLLLYLFHGERARSVTMLDVVRRD